VVIRTRIQSKEFDLLYRFNQVDYPIRRVALLARLLGEFREYLEKNAPNYHGVQRLDAELKLLSDMS